MTKPLEGLRVLNTRPKNQAQALSLQIIEAGGISIECPTLEIQATNSNWINSLGDLNQVDCAIFISSNAAYYCFKELKQNNTPWPCHIKVIAIGQATAKTLNEWGIHVSELPEQSDSEHLLKLSILKTPKNQSVLLFKGEGGRTLIEEELTNQKAHVQSIDVYQRNLPKSNPLFIESLWRDDLVDIILVTSEQSLQNLFTLFGQHAASWVQSKPCLVLSARLAQCAEAAGIKKIIITHPDRMMNTLFDYYKGLAHGQ